MRLEDEIEWALEVNSRSKLAFYRKIKHSVGIEGYVTAKWLSKSQRSAITNARAGTLPLEVEKGRWRNVPLPQRICKQCDLGEVEDLDHFVLKCPFNNNERNLYLDGELNVVNCVSNSNCVKALAKFISSSLRKNRK